MRVEDYHAKKLSFFRRTQMEAGYEVDGVGNQSAHDECPGGGRSDVRNLLTQLYPVVFNPATRV